MASVEKRGDAYRITVFLGRDGQQKLVRKRTTYVPETMTETGRRRAQSAIDKDVENYANAFERKVLAGEYLDGEEISFDEYTKIWEKDYAEINLTERVAQDYSNQLQRRASPSFGHLPIAKIKPDHIQRIVNSMQRPDPKTGKVYAPKTIKSFFIAVNSVLKYAERMEVISSNPCNKVKLPAIKNLNEMQPFTEEQAVRFLSFVRSGAYEKQYSGHERTMKETGKIYSVSDYTETRKIHIMYQSLFVLALVTGLRRGELVALNWEDVDFDKNTISVTKAVSKVKGRQIIKEPKTHAGKRTVDLDPDTVSLLKQWQTEQKLLCFRLGSAWEGYRGDEFNKNCLFINLGTGKRMDIDTIGHHFRDLLIDYNRTCKKEEDQLPLIRFHDLRHTNATLLLAKGFDPVSVAGRLGHENPSVTLNVYAHATKENGEKVARFMGELFAVNK